MKFKQIKDLKTARVLIANDDGIDAPGIKVLEEETRKICDDVWVVAPCCQKSGASHAVSPELCKQIEFSPDNGLPTIIRQIDDRHFAVNGTPADCVNFAIDYILKDKLPDLVLSGINYGRNVAEDVSYSGTIGAGIEALISGVPAIAFSQHLNDGDTDWEIARKYIAPLVKKLANMTFAHNTLVSVNFPNIPLAALKGITVARQGEWRFAKKPGSFALPSPGNFQDLEVPEFLVPNDIEAWEQNKISITPLNIDITDYPALDPLREALKGL